MTAADHDSEALAAAAELRIALKDAVSMVERAAASPSAMPSWRGYVLEQVETLRGALDRHVVEVEGEDGLLAELTEAAPRLANKINMVRDEHPVLCDMTAATITLIKESDDTEAIRSSILDTLLAIARHRQRGADLVYEGYNVDVGGG